MLVYQRVCVESYLSWWDDHKTYKVSSFEHDTYDTLTYMMENIKLW